MHLSLSLQRSFPTMRLVALLAVFVLGLIANTLLASSVNAETRTLRMYYGHSKESATITFKRNGKYIKSGLRKANRFLRDWRRKEPTRMDPALLDLVWEVYRASGSRKPIQVISGYRSPKTNNMLRRRGRKVAKSSQHTRGKALDFYLTDVSVKKLRALGLKAHRGGVGYYRGSFVHLDTGSVRHWPRMSRKQLARVFPRGKTIHVPSNGRPLRGYKTAMANLKRGLNADGSKRSSRVNRTLLARLFRPSSETDDGDAPRARRAKKPVKKAPVAAKPAPKKPAPKKPEPKKKQVLVAKGPDPFSVESTAVSAAEKRRIEQEKVEELAKRAEEQTQIAGLAPERVTVPRRRPSRSQPEVAQTQLALAPEAGAIEDGLKPAKLSPVGATELALAAPQGLRATSIDAIPRPRIDVPVSAKKVPEPVTAPADEQKVAALKTRINAAFSPQQADAVDNPTSLFPANVPKPKSPQFRPSLADRLSVPVPSQPKLQKEQTVLQAALESSSSKDKLRNVASPSWRVKQEESVSKEVAVAVPAPADKPALVLEPAVKAESTGAPTPMVAELDLGDLEGRSVQAWAIAVTTRVGLAANLQAPVYRQGTRRATPASVYSLGFAFNRAPLRSDRFSGRAVTRVAFAHFGSTN